FELTDTVMRLHGRIQQSHGVWCLIEESKVHAIHGLIAFFQRPAIEVRAAGELVADSERVALCGVAHRAFPNTAVVRGDQRSGSSTGIAHHFVQLPHTKQSRENAIHHVSGKEIFLTLAARVCLELRMKMRHRSPASKLQQIARRHQVCPNGLSLPIGLILSYGRVSRDERAGFSLRFVSLLHRTVKTES